MAKLTLQHITGNTYLIPAPANIGVFAHDGRAILIDSGNNKEAGRQIYKALSDKEWRLDLIINTHSNADHIGGNAFLQNKTNCRIAATQIEAAFIRDPLLEPAYLYGGFPFKSLRNRFLMAPPSTVTDVISSSGRILDSGLEAVALPGHYMDMIGVRTPDDVLFIADSLFPETVINKYHLFVLFDLQGQLETLQRLKAMTAVHYIPGHGPPAADISSLIELNRAKIEEIMQQIETVCRRPFSFESILQEICRNYRLELDANQYVLIGSTIRSYLAYLLDTRRVDTCFADGRLLWQTF